MEEEEEGGGGGGGGGVFIVGCNQCFGGIYCISFQGACLSEPSVTRLTTVQVCTAMQNGVLVCI